MAFEDLQERFKSEWQQTVDRLQETSLYHQLKDRYDGMSPVMQKVSIAAGAFLVAATFLSFPYGYYSESSLQEDTFLQKRDTLKALLKVTRETRDVPTIAPAPDASALKTMVDSRITAAQLRPEQISGVNITEGKSQLIPPNLTDSAVEVNLSKLNLKQANDLAASLQGINPSVKMTELTLKPHSQDERYLDVYMKLIALKVPQVLNEQEEVQTQ